MRLDTELAWPAVLGEALRDGSCVVHGLRATPFPLPMTHWRATATESDRAVLAHCVGATLDVGCGPGRMTEALMLGGHAALGVDVVAEAVDQTRARGAMALLRDVFSPLPAEGRWQSALLADGNVGIGGDPPRLLRRVASLLVQHGRVVLDLAQPGVGLRTRMVKIESGRRRSLEFPWTLVGPESLGRVARPAGLFVHGLHQHDGRWFAVLAKQAP